VNGQQVAHYDESTTVDVLSQVTAFSNSNGTGDYVVQEGDTLKSIAQAVYGNASLWYVVAQANALTGDADLAVGLSLSIPAVTTSKNDSTTFKPYNPSEIQGSTTPNLPVIAPPPPPPKQHCNVIAAIVVIAVVVAASFIVGPLAGAALQSSLAGFAVGAAAGSTAGQLAGDALGTHQGFSFGEVFTAAATAVVTAGVGNYLSTGSAFTSAAEATANAAAQGTTATISEVGFVGHVIEGAAGYVAEDAAAKLVGQPAHFSWAGLVAGSLASGVASEFGPTQQELRAGGDTTAFEAGSAALAQGVVQREASVVLGDHHVQSWESIGENAVGSYVGAAVGNALDPTAFNRRQAALEGKVSQDINGEIAGVNAGIEGSTEAALRGYFAAANGAADSQLAAALAPTQPPSPSLPTIDDLMNQAKAVQAGEADGSMSTAESDRALASRKDARDRVVANSTQQADQAVALLNDARSRIAANGVQGQTGDDRNVADQSNAGTGRANGDYDNGILNVDIYGSRTLGATDNLSRDVEAGIGGGWNVKVGDALHNIVTGALVNSMNMIYQPVAQVHDLAAVGYGFATGGHYQPEYWSSTGQQAVADRDPWDHTGENLLSSNPITGLPFGAYQVYQSAKAGDYAKVQQQVGGFAGVLLFGKAGGLVAGEGAGFPGGRIETILERPSAEAIDTTAVEREAVTNIGRPVDVPSNEIGNVKLGFQTLDPTTIGFTQSSVSFAKAGASYDLESLVASMSKDGWVGKPIDVVAMPDGTLASIDNTRVLAARMANIDVQANVRGFDELITDPVRQFSLTEAGVVPDTWGDAALLRINKPIQNATYPNMSPSWSTRFPNGSLYDPEVK